MARWSKLFTSTAYTTEYSQLVWNLLVLVYQLIIAGPHLKLHTSNLNTYLNLEDTPVGYASNQIDFTFKTQDEFSEERASVVTPRSH